MKSSIDDLVSMRDVEGLVEIMNESEDWMDQLDAAEGLVLLGDRRGLEHLLIARQSEIEDVRQVATEILSNPEIVRMREKMIAEQRLASEKLRQGARERLKQGKTAFLHKVVYLPFADFFPEDLFLEGLRFYELEDAGMEGWELIHILPRRQLQGGGLTDHQAGAYAFLKKELALDDLTKEEK